MSIDLSVSYRVLRKLLGFWPIKGVPLFYRIIFYLNWKNSGNFKFRPNPLKILHVSPAEINYLSLDRFAYSVDPFKNTGKSIPGDWDLSNKTFENNATCAYKNNSATIYEAIELRFKKGVEWNDTPFIQDVINAVKDKKKIWHKCQTMKDIQLRCRKMEELYSSIKYEGYIRQEETMHTDVKNPEYFRRKYDEIVVNIGRDGTLLFVGGQHRLSMAKILGIPKVPVRVHVRHKSWHEKLEKMNERKINIIEHVDTEEICNNQINNNN